MANDFLAIADLLADALDLSGAELSEIREASPVLDRLPAISSSNGDTHKYTVNTQHPVVGFRAENSGRDFDHSIHRIDTVTLKILDYSFMVDKAVADRWRQGGAEALIAREGMMHLKSAMYQLENQFINGTVSGNAAGFAGLKDSSFLDAVADEMVIDKGGVAVGAQSSVWLMRVNPSECGMVIQGDGLEWGDTIVQNFVDGSSQNLPAYYTPACMWSGCQAGSKYSVARIANVDATATLNDDDIYGALKLFPAGFMPNMIVMNQTVLEQLRASRTATNVTGAPAPLPTEVAGIPIVTSDAVKQTDAVLA